MVYILLPDTSVMRVLLATQQRMLEYCIDHVARTRELLRLLRDPEWKWKLCSHPEACPIQILFRKKSEFTGFIISSPQLCKARLFKTTLLTLIFLVVERLALTTTNTLFLQHPTLQHSTDVKRCSQSESKNIGLFPHHLLPKQCTQQS